MPHRASATPCASPEPAGAALEPLPDADEQTRLLAFLGRKAWT